MKNLVLGTVIFAATAVFWLSAQATQDAPSASARPADSEESKRERHWRLMQLAAEARRSDIVFFGRVVDQHDQPVADATVEFVARSGYLVEGDGKQFVSTDDQGYFKVHEVSGTGLTINQISKTGYTIFTGHLDRFDNYQRFSDSALWADHGSVETAAVYPAWKIDGTYPRTSVVASAYKFQPNTVYSLDLLSREGAVKVVEGEHGLDLQVVFERSPTTWAFHLTTPNGGLIEYDGSHTFEAPADGYSTDSFRISGNQESPNETRHFFVRSRDHYSRVEFEIVPYYGPKSHLGYRLMVNLEQERLLIAQGMTW